MSLFIEILVRVTIIVTLTDLIEFYVIQKRLIVVTFPLIIAIILITIIPIVINVWYSFYRRGINLGDFIK
jgi:ABC-type sugar transport system permease subunit